MGKGTKCVDIDSKIEEIEDELQQEIDDNECKEEVPRYGEAYPVFEKSQKCKDLEQQLETLDDLKREHKC